MPRQEVVNLLQRQGPAPGPFAGHYARGIDAWPTMTGDEMQGDMKRTAATTTALQMIFEVMVVRNIEAIALEREGRQEEAMKLYEQNTADAFDGPHPYQRLLALYTASGRVEDAIRACEAFISTNLRGLRPDNAQTDHFRNAINRLRGDDCVG
jgi:tetratricopeptide (TPR) repeat protein